MKKLLIILLFCLSLKATSQPPINATNGSPSSAVLTRGVAAADSGYWYRTNFPDTTTANQGYLKNTPGVLIRVADTILYLRNQATTAWIKINGAGGGGSSSPPNVVNGLSYNPTNDTIVNGGDAFRHIHYWFKQNLYQDAPYSLMFFTNSALDSTNAVNLTQARVDTTGAVSMIYMTRRFDEANGDTAYHSHYGGAIQENDFHIFDSTSTRFNKATGTYIAFPYIGFNNNHYVYPPKIQTQILSESFGQTGSSYNSAFNLGEAWGYNMEIINPTADGYPLVAGYHSNLDFARIRPHNQRIITGNGVASFESDWRSYQSAIVPSETNWGHYISKAIGFAAYGDHDYATVGAGGATKAKILQVSKVDSSIGFIAYPQFRNNNEVYNGYGFISLGDSDLSHFQGKVRIGGPLPTHQSGWPQYDLTIPGNMQVFDFYLTSGFRAVGAAGLNGFTVLRQPENSTLYVGTQSQLGALITINGDGLTSGAGNVAGIDMDASLNVNTSAKLRFITELAGVETVRFQVGSIRSNSVNTFLASDTIITSKRISSLLSTDSVVVIDANGVLRHRAQSDISVTTSTLQQVMTAGSALTASGTNTIDVNSGTLNINNANILNLGAKGGDIETRIERTGVAADYARIYHFINSSIPEIDFEMVRSSSNIISQVKFTPDSLSFLPYRGRITIDSLRNGFIDTATYKPMAWSQANQAVVVMNSWAQVSGGGSSIISGFGLSGTSTFILDTTIAADKVAVTNVTSAWQYTTVQKYFGDGLGTTQSATKGILLINNVPAVIGSQQISPAIVLEGQGFATTPATSQAADFRFDVTPTQGSTAIIGTLNISAATNGGAYTSIFNISSTGNLGLGVSPLGKLDIGTGSAILGSVSTSSTGTNSNFITGATTGTTGLTGTPWLLPGGAGTAFRVGINGSTATTQTAGQDYFQLIVAGGLFTEAGSSTAPRAGGLAILRQTITNGAGATDTLVGLYVAGAPIGITAATGSWGAIFANGDILIKNGNVALNTAGNKLKIASGSNASIGTATLSGGTVTVSTTAVTASSIIFLTDATTGVLTNVGSPTVGTITAGVSFVINSTNVLDASNVNWLIVN